MTQLHNTTHNIIINAVLIVISCAFILIFLEGSVRIFYPSPSGALRHMMTADEKLCFRWTPNFKGTINAKEYTTELNINEEGFRDQTYNNTAGEKIIFSIGDSMTAAQQVPADKTFSKLLQQKLGMQYFVMNLGVPGYNPSQYYVLLEQMLQKHKPEIILLNFFTGNDFIPTKKDFRKNKCAFTVVNGYEVNAEHEKLGMIFNTRVFLAHHSQLYNIVSDLINTNYYIKKILSDRRIVLSSFYPEDFIIYDSQHPNYKDVYETTFAIIKEINSLTKKHNSRLIINIIPPQEHVREELFEEIKRFYNLPKELSFNHAYEKLKNFLKKENITFSDTLAILDKNKNQELYFKHDKHFTQKAHEIIANHTQTFLKTHLLATKDAHGNPTTRQ